MYVFVIRVTVQGFIRILLWIKEMVYLRFPKSTDIFVLDALLVSNVEDFTDRMSLDFSCGCNHTIKEKSMFANTQRPPLIKSSFIDGVSAGLKSHL